MVDCLHTTRAASTGDDCFLEMYLYGVNHKYQMRFNSSLSAPLNGKVIIVHYGGIVHERPI